MTCIRKRTLESDLMPSFLNITKDLRDCQDPILGQERSSWQSHHHSLPSSLTDAAAGQTYSNVHSYNLDLRFKMHTFQTNGESALSTPHPLHIPTHQCLSLSF